jgi:hypothetical protein
MACVLLRILIIGKREYDGLLTFLWAIINSLAIFATDNEIVNFYLTKRDIIKKQTKTPYYE